MIIYFINKGDNQAVCYGNIVLEIFMILFLVFYVKGVQ